MRNHLLIRNSSTDEQYMYDNKLAAPTQVSMQMFEVFSDQVRDLLTVPKTGNEYAELDEAADTGVFVKVRIEGYRTIGGGPNRNTLTS